MSSEICLFDNGNKAVSVIDSLSLFKRQINSINKLDAEEEFKLAKDFFDNKNSESAHKLVVHNLYFVYFKSLDYLKYNIPQMDIIQQGTIGLMKAIKKFDPYKGFRLSTFANYWIIAEINDYILDNWTIVRVGTHKLRKKIFYGLGKAKDKIAALTGEGIDDVSSQYGITNDEYKVVSNSLLRKDFSLSHVNSDSESCNIDKYLVDESSCVENIVSEKQEESFVKDCVFNAMKSLDDRERYIIEQRFFSESTVTLQELANYFNVSVERIRQLESRALKKLKENKYIEKMV